MRQSETSATIAAAIVLVVGMGFGRFAFTGLYPLMVADQQISVEGGSYAASVNYAGYLIGALLAALLSGIPSRRMCTFAVVTTVACLALLAIPMPAWLIVAVRGFSGISSAIAMVAASNWLIHERRHHHGAPTLFAGVGLGILISAEMIAISHVFSLSSHAIWLVLALGALALTVVSTIMQASADRLKPAPMASHSDYELQAPPPFGAARLILIYGLAGLGYIITATYLPLLVRSAVAIDPVHIWAIFGLGAVPSCFVWHALHERLGTRRSLIGNLTLQAVGVLLPVWHTPMAYILSALLVGATFMGTVTIAMPAARRVAAKVRFNMLAIMTAAYGIGQIIGPLVANSLYTRTGTFDLPLVLAALALMLAACMCIGRPSKKRTQERLAEDRHMIPSP
ncbi:YbfB/YjiJ family MFS transporter [Agrobacterium rhizogenes]|jgi:predicted MFS family arabinose efflux permease|nr:YbfB/YjiJ family MFS transporter [Rhizobium rhizogenes]NTH61816.1 YbfB/YjiJ family MFS transporter [Rhizobium rhizogenes]NTH93442.1 YbfB/YjiJ family MFS transporter [Rhizobium rhizogenes]